MGGCARWPYDIAAPWFSVFLYSYFILWVIFSLCIAEMWSWLDLGYLISFSLVFFFYFHFGWVWFCGWFVEWGLGVVNDKIRPNLVVLVSSCTAASSFIGFSASWFPASSGIISVDFVICFVCHSASQIWQRQLWGKSFLSCLFLYI